MHALRSTFLFAPWFVLSLIGSGCGSPFASGTETSSATSSASGQGGASSSSSSTGGMGGTGGQSSCGDMACSDGQFCASDGQCTSCADLSKPLAFGAPQPIGMTLGKDPWFPRTRDEDGNPRLVYAAQTEGLGDTFDVATMLWDGAQWGTSIWLGSSVNTSIAQETAPLMLPIGQSLPGIPIAADQTLLLFSVEDANAIKKIFYVDSGIGSRTYFTEVNNVVGGITSFSIAVAYQLVPARYWYMHQYMDSSVLTLNLVTKLAEDPSIQPISMALPMDCSLDQTPDVAPFVTPDGELLLFQAKRSFQPGCADNLVTKIFVARLDGSGQPKAEPTELPIDTISQDDELFTPSLSADRCTLYFAANLNGSRSIYTAHRK